MKKWNVFLACLMAVSAFGFASCGEKSSNSGNSNNNSESSSGGETQQPEETQMLFDTKFEKGISVSSLLSAEQSYTTWNYSGEEYTEPFWQLGQYGDLSSTRKGYDSTKNDLSLGSELFGIPAYGITGTTEDGKHTLTNQSGSKFMSIDTKNGAVNLTVDTTKEYINQETGALQKRVNGEDWVHMILSQQCGTVYLDQVDSFVMELDFTLTTNEILDTSIGAAQFQWIFSVKDAESVIGDYFWFNVCLFDNRYENFPGTQMYDSGKADATGKFIYAPTGKDLFGETGGKVEVGKTYHVVLDLKAHMQNAFNIAKGKGALAQSEWKNMRINGFNLGWEVSNLAKVGVEISNLALKKVDKAM